MLVPIQRSGSKPPLFLVHGMFGVIAAASTFVRVLGPDRPLYAVLANGIDGRQPVIDDLGEMKRAYVEEIRTARPTGSLHIGGVCEGGPVAIHIAPELPQEWRQGGPVILVGPPGVPPCYHKRNPMFHPHEPT